MKQGSEQCIDSGGEEIVFTLLTYMVEWRKECIDSGGEERVFTLHLHCQYIPSSTPPCKSTE